MSINALGGVSLYEYYYKINNKKEKEASPKENVNIQASPKEEPQTAQEVSYENRPWANLMQQLGIPFDSNPKNDIENIKKALADLIKDFEDDDELSTEIREIKDYIEQMYDKFIAKPNSTADVGSSVLNELFNISLLNKADMI